MKKMINRVRNIYEHLQDEKSKFIFNNRILYSLTGDGRYICEIVASLPQMKGLDKVMAFCEEHIDNVVFYGAGNDLEHLIYQGLHPKYICDKSVEKQQHGWRNVAVMSPEELIRNNKGKYVAVSTSLFYEQINQFLLDNGFEQEKIIDMFGDMKTSLDTEQYFDADIMTPQQGETLIDGGCLDCGTDEVFIKWCSGDYHKIYAFEPDRKNYEGCIKASKRNGIRNIEILNKGLWDCATELPFMEVGDSGSKISGETGNKVISTVKVDDIVGNDRVSLIKLDVEGAELKALRGAEQTIRRCRPRLAICVYHKPEDILEIPEYVLSLHSDYKIFIRHYSMTHFETVMYAI